MDEMPRKSTTRELVEQTVVGGVGMVPLVGSPVAVAFAYAMGWTYNKRMRQWLEDLAGAVEDLQSKSEDEVSIEDLKCNDVFVDAVVQATRAAQATHQSEKLNALRNGVLHSIGECAPTGDEQARFFRLVDEFTPAHLRLLTFLQDPRRAFERRLMERPDLGTPVTSARIALLMEAVPGFMGEQEWANLLDADLRAAHLVDGIALDTITQDELWRSSITPLGQRFLAFIADPTGTER